MVLILLKKIIKARFDNKRQYFHCFYVIITMSQRNEEGENIEKQKNIIVIISCGNDIYCKWMWTKGRSRS